METYSVYSAEPGKRERFVMDIKAHSLQAAWLGAKPWFVKGMFHVFPKGDRAGGSIFTK